MEESKDSTDTQELICRAFIDGAKQTFERVLGLDNLQVNHPTTQHFAYPEPFISTISIKGAVRGDVLIEASSPSACYLVSKMLEIDGEDLSEEEIADGWGELNNIVTGNAKGTLSKFDLSFDLGLPTLSKRTPDVESKPKLSPIVVPLAVGEHSFSLTLLLDWSHEQTVKFLVVDDSSTMRKIISRSLEKIGFDDITQAANGVEALQHIEDAGPFDMILSDWNMPEMDGYTFLCKLREYDTQTPFMMVTTESGKDSLVKAIQAGANHYIVKPFDTTDLQRRIQQTLQQFEALKSLN